MKSRTLAAFLLLLLFVSPAPAAEIETLPSTAPLEWQGELADRMMDGLHVYIERKIAESVDKRAKYWHRDTSSPKAYEKSIAENRERFKKIVGLTDQRSLPRAEIIAPGLEIASTAAATDVEVFRLRWRVIDGVEWEGLLVLPRGGKDKPVATVVVLPDADQNPEALVGLIEGLPNERQIARRLGASGCVVIVPRIVDRRRPTPFSISRREWVYRQAYHMGRHLIGYEIAATLAILDGLSEEFKESKCGIAGYGEGGLIALYAAACDPRIEACLVSGYFEERSRPWREPLERNVWSLLREFGDAEIATLLAPRGIVVEHTTFPKVREPQPGERRTIGHLVTPDFASVEREFDRIEATLPNGFQRRSLVDASGPNKPGPWSEAALIQFARLLELKSVVPTAEEPLHHPARVVDAREWQARLVEQLESHIQKLLREADETRDDFFLGKPEFKTKLPEEFAKSAAEYRERFWKENLGKLDDEPLPLNPRSRKIYDRPKWTGYDVVLDVFPDVFAWGVLLVPKDLKPGERRPVVVCQHGRNGVPKDTIEGDVKAYHDYAAHLADRGLIVFSPHNPYRGEDKYRLLNRKANAVGCTLFSFILAQHEQILKWLGSLPQVDPERIAFYGLSYGGETAVRVPPLLPGYCLSICSADFNDWARKVASTDSKYSFMYTIEWEMPYFNLGSTFNYAEMVALLAPRPFMVERGHDDGVAPDEWVAYEYAKVRRLYDQLGIGDRTDIEFFSGGHTINGQGTFRFLEKHLNWPMPVMGKE